MKSDSFYSNNFVPLRSRRSRSIGAEEIVPVGLLVGIGAPPSGLDEDIPIGLVDIRAPGPDSAVDADVNSTGSGALKDLVTVGVDFDGAERR